MAQQPRFIDIHILQSLPPSNINRDDTGSPKTAFFGGVRRTRVSSQAWKKATRDVFREQFEQDGVGEDVRGDRLLTGQEFSTLAKSQMTGSRTKRAVELIASSICAQDPTLTDKATPLAVGALKAADVVIKEDKGVQATGYLLFISQLQAEKLAELAIDAAHAGAEPSKKDCKAALRQNNAVDMALFGRMVADDPSLNIDAACQVAHAIGIHQSENEFDYFTAMDDRSPDDNAGAGMIGTIEFTSSTLYRYATLNVLQLRENLASTEVTVRAVEAFVEAFITSMPTGKQNTFANRTLPSAVVVQVRDCQPVSLVNAFEKPIAAEDRMQNACQALVEQEKLIDAAFGTTPLHSYVIQAAPDTDALEQMGTVLSLAEVIDKLAADVRDCLPVDDETTAPGSWS